MKKNLKRNRGMTYVELIVVLTIFSIVSSVAIYNYRGFQDSVDIKNLSSDIALKIVEAQKSALNGKLPTLAYPPGWKPSYGVAFNMTYPKNFGYYADLDQNGKFLLTNLSELVENVAIAKSTNSISSLAVFNTDGSSNYVDDLSINFTRPNPSAFFSDSAGTIYNNNASYIQISITSGSNTSAVKLYRSGRIEIGVPDGVDKVFVNPGGPPQPGGIGGEN